MPQGFNFIFYILVSLYFVTYDLYYDLWANYLTKCSCLNEFADLPGFYYDPEKNRYFPIKGPIPGSTRKQVLPPQNPVSLPTTVSFLSEKFDYF